MDPTQYLTFTASSSSPGSTKMLSALHQLFYRKMDSKKTAWYLVNAVVVCYVSRRILLEGWGWLQTQSNLRRLQQRCWDLATQGAEAAGAVSAGLGEPDQHDVYCYTSASGTTLYFRQGWQASGKAQWEWSTDKNLWIPACHADSLYYSAHSTPSSADKVFIQQLHIETQIIAKQTRHSSIGAGLPPLDLSNAERDISQLSQVPAAFLCPISMRVMTQPVVTPSGASFDRPAILDWIRQHHTDPVSGHPLRSDELYPNLVMRDMIHAWAHAQKQQPQPHSTEPQQPQQDKQQLGKQQQQQQQKMAMAVVD